MTAGHSSEDQSKLPVLLKHCLRETRKQPWPAEQAGDTVAPDAANILEFTADNRTAIVHEQMRMNDVIGIMVNHRLVFRIHLSVRKKPREPGFTDPRCRREDPVEE